jgi:hypothetical protein
MAKKLGIDVSTWQVMQLSIIYRQKNYKKECEDLK